MQECAILGPKCVLTARQFSLFLVLFAKDRADQVAGAVINVSCSVDIETVQQLA